ncbi:MAG: NAD-glutamate dehydrogenase [Granulosicoccus sp.]
MAKSDLLPQPVAPDREELLERILEVLPKSLDKAHQKQLSRFIPLWLGGASADELTALSPEDLTGALLSHWQLLKTHNANEPVYRIINPSVEQQGWHSAHSVIELAAVDQPWLVSSLRSALSHADYEIHLFVHPIMAIERNTNGDLLSVEAAHHNNATTRLESLIHIEIDCIPADQHAKLIELIDRTFLMLDVRRQDSEALQEQVALFADHIKGTEQADFVRWLDARQFACLGTASILPDDDGQLARLNNALGILSSEAGTDAWTAQDVLPQSSLHMIVNADDVVQFCKASRTAPLIRNEHADLILIPHRDSQKHLTQVDVIVGLFVSGLQNEAVSSIPWLRERVERVIGASGISPDSHNGKAIAATLRGLPREMLLHIRSEPLLEMVSGIVSLNERQRVKLFSSTDAFGRFCNCLVYLPRDTYSRELRLSIEAILLTHVDATAASFDIRFSSDSALARLHFVIQMNEPLGRTIDWQTIERRIRTAAITWNEQLESCLRDQHDEFAAMELQHKYSEAFPASYREDYSARTAAADIEFIEQRLTGAEPVMSFYRHIVIDSGTVNFKLFARNQPVPLSDVIPVIENMGLRVETEHPFEIRRRDGETVWIHEFTVAEPGDDRQETADAAARIQEAFRHIWRGAVENDGFNQLILAAGLDWRQVVVLRALCKYLLQIDIPFSQDYMIDSLVANTAITRQLVELFEQRFNPALENQDTSVNLERLDAELDAVISLDEDRILRSYRNLIMAILRTNAWRTDDNGRHRDYLSFKFDSANIAELPLPRPLYEIFVYAADFEGIHLRGGSVARGGLRWSDRREDFRTEVLGLMKAQMVKNAVIVPVGSKGGFHVKATLPAEREAMMEVVINCYRNFLRGLLDITDNIIGDSIVPPPQVVRHDSDDPYLVVAADKGTATFSDYANAVAIDYGFWLGDAFASGGSQGYDHKVMGITARGGWESVKRHFRMLGTDIQQEPFRVVGIGDMAGDVFGNGMLLSKQIKLVAAFNHQHIFIDPDPDASTTWQERSRLFSLPRSSWSDYDLSLISKGGGIFSRQDKQIVLSGEARKALGITEDKLTPTALITAILKAPVDLLWNGGIGTYVKAHSESTADAADRANDALRIDGRELKCRVVGEGGNLGFTQLGRIEYARNGGLIYTDAIDNSAGVDCSDHEVNIKILLNAVVTNEDMTVKQRDTLLESMTDEVGELVLIDNYLQTQCIDLCTVNAGQALDEQARMMLHLESIGRLDRDIEFLPNGDEIAERLANETGLVRPEVAVLVSYSKMVMYDELLASDFTTEAALEPVLLDYFPTELRDRFSTDIHSHRLRNEIVATVVTNDVVNRLGPTFAYRMAQELGTTSSELAEAFVVVRNIFRLPALWQSIESLDNQIECDVQHRMQILVRGLVERATHWLLRSRRTAQGITGLTAHFATGLDELKAAMPDCLAAVQRETLNQRIEHFSTAGVPDDIANAVAMVVPLSSSLDIVEIANSLNQPVNHTAAVYFELGSFLDLYWLRDQISQLRVSTHWHTLAASELRNDLHYQQRHICAEVTNSTGADRPAADRVAAWTESNRTTVAKYHALLTDMKAATDIDFAMLSLAVNEVHKLLRSDRPLAS